jgi:putative iron-regulated protein
MGRAIGALLVSVLCLSASWVHADPLLEKTAADQTWLRSADQLERVETSVAQFNNQLNLFLTQTNEHEWQQLRQRWRQAHDHWQELNLLWRLAENNPVKFAELRRWIFQIDAQELQPGYLDSLPDYPFSGLVNDLAIPLTVESLRQQHGLTDSSEVAQGFHALELLLWGAEGQRQFTDFVKATQLSTEERAAGYTIGELPNNRRRQLLQVVGQILQQDVREMLKQWKLQESNLGRNYWRLQNAQRLPLLRQAAQAELFAISAQQHGSFSLTDNEAIESARQQQLQALRRQLTHGEPSLLTAFMPKEQADRWMERLDQANQDLQQEGTRATAIEQLKILAEELDP